MLLSMFPIVYEYDPFVIVKEYDDPVIFPDVIPLDRFTYHVDPDGNPDSLNVTVYVCNLKDRLICLFEPFTDTDPDMFM